MTSIFKEVFAACITECFFISIFLSKKKKITKKHSENADTSTSSMWPFTLWCDLDLMLRSIKLMLLDVAYCIVPLYQVWCLWVYYVAIYHHSLILFGIWPSLVTFSFFQGHLYFNHCMYFMLLNVCTKKEVCSSSRIWNMNICTEKTWMPNNQNLYLASWLGCSPLQKSEKRPQESAIHVNPKWFRINNSNKLAYNLSKYFENINKLFQDYV